MHYTTLIPVPHILVAWLLLLAPLAIRSGHARGQTETAAPPAVSTTGDPSTRPLATSEVDPAQPQVTQVADGQATGERATDGQATDGQVADVQAAEAAQAGPDALGQDAAVQDAAGTDEHAEAPPLITNDAVIFGILLAILGFVFWSSTSEFVIFRTFYKVVPMLLMCYFLPSLLTLFGVVDPELSKLYHVVSRYLLPACLVLLTLSVDLKEIFKLGPKALIMFLTGTCGVILGGPLAILIVSVFAPDLVGGEGADATWRGLSTVAGSWIGGGANQAAMKEVFQPSSDLFSTMVAVDVLVAEFWMMFLLLGIGKSQQIDALFKADASSIETLKSRMENFRKENERNPSTTDLFVILAIAFGCTAIAHAVADILAPWLGSLSPEMAKFSLDSKFFWLIVTATTLGVCLSFTPLRRLEGAGASKLGTIFIFILVATIGLGMDISAVFSNAGVFVVGLIWMMIHVFLLLVVGYLIRAPYFFLAVGSKANIGGAASAPVVAAAFHPSLAPVGVLLAVLGYVFGTYGAYLCGLMMQFVAPGS